MVKFSKLTNPVWKTSDNLRDPAVFKEADGCYHLFYSRFSNKDWNRPENWAIGHVKTRDFVNFENDRDISPKGYASPGDLIYWNDTWILPYQSYPAVPTMLCYSTSKDLVSWSEPVFFLKEAMELPWNQAHRVIDPTFVAEGSRLHCYFVSTDLIHYERWTNLVGHAYTDDPQLKEWVITTVEEPLIGAAENAPDGAENVAVFPGNEMVGSRWIMIFSEGLKKQHLAGAVSDDLMNWKHIGAIDIELQDWMRVRYGAPYVWKETDGYVMILMGENESAETTFGLLTSDDGIHWSMLKEEKDKPMQSIHLYS